MATLRERIEDDYKTAMKAQDRLRIDTLRLVKAALQRVAMDKRKDALDDTEITQVLMQQAKQRNETLEMAKQNSRQDVVAQTQQELAVIAAYLPKQMSADELRKIIDEAIAAVGPNQGPIMKFVMAKVPAGTSDGKIVSQLVAERLKGAAK